MSLEFDLVLKGEQLGEKFQAKWSLWCRAVIHYALQINHKPVPLKYALQDLESDYEGEYCAQQHNSNILYCSSLQKKTPSLPFAVLATF